MYNFMYIHVRDASIFLRPAWHELMKNDFLYFDIPSTQKKNSWVMFLRCLINDGKKIKDNNQNTSHISVRSWCFFKFQTVTLLKAGYKAGRTKIRLRHSDCQVWGDPIENEGMSKNLLNLTVFSCVSKIYLSLDQKSSASFFFF